jgi:hypothetical protein
VRDCAVNLNFAASFSRSDNSIAESVRYDDFHGIDRLARHSVKKMMTLLVKDPFAANYLLRIGCYRKSGMRLRCK